MALDKRYIAVATPPQEALKVIEAGKLKGKYDINPQHRIEAMTNVYGLCGEGWKYEIYHMENITCPEGEVLFYMIVAVSIKQSDGTWSAPIYGCGGDYIIAKNKNGLVPNDEAFKMAQTDALGNALKMLGVCADVYKGKFDTKYGNRADFEFKATATAPQEPETQASKSNGKSYVSTPGVCRCESCGTPIRSAKVQQFSYSKFGHYWCMDCQKTMAA